MSLDLRVSPPEITLSQAEADLIAFIKEHTDQTTTAGRLECKQMIEYVYALANDPTPSNFIDADEDEDAEARKEKNK